MGGERLKDLLLLQLAQGEGGMKTLLPYLLQGKEVPSEVKYKPLSDLIFKNLVDQIDDMDTPERNRLLAAVVLERMADTQEGELRDTLLLRAHEEIRDILGPLAPIVEQKVAESGAKAESSKAAQGQKKKRSEERTRGHL